jgi:hypothetical protein
MISATVLVKDNCRIAGNIKAAACDLGAIFAPFLNAGHC